MNEIPGQNKRKTNSRQSPAGDAGVKVLGRNLTMETVIIYRGGKSKEIISFIRFILANFDRYIEHFFGWGIILSHRASSGNY